MTHEEIKILISAYTDGEVTSSQKELVEEHLKTCASCQNDYKTYKAMSSSLLKWSDETLSPDESMKVQKRFEQRREPMFTTRNLLAFGTTLALTIIIGSVLQQQINSQRQLQVRAYTAAPFDIFKKQAKFKAAADDIGDQYSDGNYLKQKVSIRQARLLRQSSSYEPYYLSSNYSAAENQVSDKRLGAGLLVGQDSMMLAGAVNQNASLYAAKEAAPMFAQATVVQGMPQQVNYDRKIIRNAQITIKVQNALNTQNALEDLIGRFHGAVNSFNMDKLDDNSRRGVMVFSVSPQSLDEVLKEIRKLGEVDSENQAGSDVTNQYSYIQARLANLEIERERLQKVLKRNDSDVGNNLYLQGQISNIEENMNALQGSLKELDRQSFMSTVTVSFYDTVPIVAPKEESLKDKTIATLKNDLKNTLETCYYIAVNSFSGIVILLSFLIQIGLWALLFWGIYLIVRRFFK